jgi:hypothetical protein
VVDVQWYISGALGEAQVMARHIRTGTADWPPLLVVVTPVHIRIPPEEQQRQARAAARVRGRGYQQPRGPRPILVVDNRDAARAAH